MLEADFTIPVYQEGDGDTKNATVHFSQLLVAHHDREIQSVFLKGSAYWWCLIIHRDADDLQPPSAILLLPLNKARHLGKTWCTPGSPEIEHNNFAAIGRQIHVPLVQIHTGKVRSGTVDSRGWISRICGRRAVQTGQKHSHHQKKKNLLPLWGVERDSSHSIPIGLLRMGTARYLRISNRALRDLCARRGIAHIRVNRTHWLFRRVVLDAW